MITQGAIGPIPDDKTHDYGKRKGLNEMMLDVFETVIYRMDDAYMRSEQTKQNIRQASEERDRVRNAGKTKVR